MGHVDQAIAGIVKVGCRGPNIVSCGVSCLLQIREEDGAVAVCELVKGLQKDRQGR